MRKIFALGLSITAAFLIAAALIMPISTQSNSQNAKKSEQSIIVTEHSYTVKAYDGKVAVFEDDAETPFKITDTSIKILPEADRDILEKGIKADTLSDISRILEDYCS